MNRARGASLLAVFLAVAVQGPAIRVAAAAQRSEGQGRGEIQWPGPGLPDLQAAIDLAPDGGIIRIQEGVYEIGRPLFVRGKRLTLIGAGNGLRNKRATQLVGRPPQPVVDERGAIILPADSVQGLWNFVGATVMVQDMRLSGFDAAIVTKADEARHAGPTTVDNVVIADTGRGILSLSPATLRVTNSTIMETRWNAIAAAPKFVTAALLGSLVATGDWIVHPFGAGIYFEHAGVDISNVDIVGAKAGGIVGFSSFSSIANSTLAGNEEGGVVLETGLSTITGNHIMFTAPLPGGVLGDGIILAAIDAQHQMFATVSKNFITISARAGLSSFGADVSINNNQIMCSTFDLDGEQQNGANYSFHDDGGNQCGCGIMGLCQAQSGMLQAPSQVGGLQ